MVMERWLSLVAFLPLFFSPEISSFTQVLFSCLIRSSYQIYSAMRTSDVFIERQDTLRTSRDQPDIAKTPVENAPHLMLTTRQKEEHNGPTDSLLHHEMKNKMADGNIVQHGGYQRPECLHCLDFSKPRVKIGQKSQTVNLSDETGRGTCWTWKMCGRGMLWGEQGALCSLQQLHEIQLHCQESNSSASFARDRARRKLETCRCRGRCSCGVQAKLVVGSNHIVVSLNNLDFCDNSKLSALLTQNVLSFFTFRKESLSKS